MTARRSTLAAAVMICGGLLAARAPAQANDSARLNALLACNTIDKKSARLACYDAQAQGAPAAVAPPPSQATPPLPSPAGAPAYSPAPTAAAAPAASFGMETKRTRERRSRPRETNSVEVRALSAVDDGIGHYTIALEDGAHWKMTESVPGFAPPRAGDQVRIRKGALGSYLMDVNKQGSIRVERIQ